MFLALDIARIVTNIGWASLVIVVLIILYRLLIRKMKKGVVDQKSYAELSSTDDKKKSGEFQFFIKLSEPKQVFFSVYGKSSDFKKVIVDEELAKGGHILKFDSTKVPNGFYYYELITDNQKTTKLIEVNNLIGYQDRS